MDSIYRRISNSDIRIKHSAEISGLFFSVSSELRSIRNPDYTYVIDNHDRINGSRYIRCRYLHDIHKKVISEAHIYTLHLDNKTNLPIGFTVATCRNYIKFIQKKIECNGPGYTYTYAFPKI